MVDTTKIEQSMAVLTQTAEQFSKDILEVRRALRGLGLKVYVAVPLKDLGLTGELSWQLIPKIDGKWTVYYRNPSEGLEEWTPANLLKLAHRHQLGQVMAQQYFVDRVTKLLKMGAICPRHLHNKSEE